jgi:hypothetical protein
MKTPIDLSKRDWIPAPFFSVSVSDPKPRRRRKCDQGKSQEQIEREHERRQAEMAKRMNEQAALRRAGKLLY